MKVWRHMSFSRFVWLLQKRKLWLSRADLLGDPWEISLAGDQLAYVISHRPISPVSTSDVEPEKEIMQRCERINRIWRQHTFVNCWSASDDESHALWRIYCPSSEGVAIQTTLPKLHASVGNLPVYRVVYEIPGCLRQTPTCIDLVTKKRPMFAYEQEVRIVRPFDEKHLEPEAVGYELEWDIEDCVESIRVHPEADNSFMETVIETVEHYAPTLKDQVAWSSMKEPPPF